MLRAFPAQVPVGVAIAKRSGTVTDGTCDEFEALAGRIAVFPIRPDPDDEALYPKCHASTRPETPAFKGESRGWLDARVRPARRSELRQASSGVGFEVPPSSKPDSCRSECGRALEGPRRLVRPPQTGRKALHVRAICGAISQAQHRWKAQRQLATE